MSKFTILFTFTNKSGNFRIDATGLLVMFLALILFPPFIAFFGFTLPTWTVLAIFFISFLHLAISFLTPIWKQVNEDMRKEKEKQNSENSPGE